MDTRRTPDDQVAAMDAGVFFRRLARVMNENPPAAEDGPALEKLKKLTCSPSRRVRTRKPTGCRRRNSQLLAQERGA